MAVDTGGAPFVRTRDRSTAVTSASLRLWGGGPTRYRDFSVSSVATARRCGTSRRRQRRPLCIQVAVLHRALHADDPLLRSLSLLLRLPQRLGRDDAVRRVSFGQPLTGRIQVQVAVVQVAQQRLVDQTAVRAGRGAAPAAESRTPRHGPHARYRHRPGSRRCAGQTGGSSCSRTSRTSAGPSSAGARPSATCRPSPEPRSTGSPQRDPTTRR
jgi:hypothetical protein